MSKSNKIIRVGDLVRIINPQFFERCGYPLSFQNAIEIVKKEYKDQISKFLKEIGITLGFENSNNMTGFKLIFNKNENRIEENRTFHKIARALAWDYVKKKNFGGKERKIYTKYQPNYFNKLMKVTKINFNQTGIYFAPSGGYDPYHMEYDYESGGLYKQKTHKILTVAEVYQTQDNKWHKMIKFVDENDDLKIEAIHVRKEQ